MNLKTISVLTALAVSIFPLKAQDLRFVEAGALTLVGKLFPETSNPYNRLDTLVCRIPDRIERNQACNSTGIAVSFRTDSPSIAVRMSFDRAKVSHRISPELSTMGLDLYIRKDGAWVWAGSAVCRDSSDAVTLVKGMDGTMHECLMYLPDHSSPSSVGIGVEAGSEIEAGGQPFRHRVAVFGSSLTHGSGCSRSGMGYPQQLSRMTGIEFINLGFGGHSRLQPYFAEILAGSDVDAYLFDAMTNPTPEEIRERLLPFIETIQAARPGVPLIFQRLIHLEKENFDRESGAQIEAKRAVADSLMAIACRKYRDVYYIDGCKTDGMYGGTSLDGVHLGDHGYTVWAGSVRRPVLRILRRYGIR